MVVVTSGLSGPKLPGGRKDESRHFLTPCGRRNKSLSTESSGRGHPARELIVNGALRTCLHFFKNKSNWSCFLSKRITYR